MSPVAPDLKFLSAGALSEPILPVTSRSISSREVLLKNHDSPLAISPFLNWSAKWLSIITFPQTSLDSIFPFTFTLIFLIIELLISKPFASTGSPKEISSPIKPYPLTLA